MPLCEAALTNQYAVFTHSSQISCFQFPSAYSTAETLNVIHSISDPVYQTVG